MTVVVNGQPRDVAEGASLDALLTTLGLSPGSVVIERNGEVVRRDEFGRIRLQDGDRLEIVRFVGGG
ncbi:MAG: sulfur carrier protein ThiS [Candidatus Dadabacteria bacterium]|nr:MAG: sulfur carrier protein ThiS [Candidatus Dadabacteria bacterium]